MRKTRSMLKSESGVALMMALFTVTLLSVFAMEMMYESSVEYAVSSHAISDVKASYAAKAGVEISLLRIHIYRKALAMAGDKLPDPSVLNAIWTVPFAWPPVVTDDFSAVDKDTIKSAVKASAMKSQYLATIQSESAKIDINDLGLVLHPPSSTSDSPEDQAAKNPHAEAIRQQLLQILNSQVENDEVFAKRYRGYDFDRLINNIADWIDPDTTSRNGGEESAAYSQLGKKTDFLPPNQPLKSLEELHQVAEMTDDIYEVLAPRLTVFGAKGINVNFASKSVLMALTPQITEERAKLILEARDDNPSRGPFKDENDFVQYLNSIGISGNPFREGNVVKVPLIFDAEHNFRIVSNGMSGKSTKTIVAVVYDTEKVKTRLTKMMTAPAPTPNPQSGASTPTPTPAPSEKAPAQAPSGRPQIVYWNES